MKSFLEVVVSGLGILLILYGLSACTSPGEPKETAEPVTGVDEYDADSWKQIISPQCKAFFDGCNQCRRAPGSTEAACTRKACFEYKKPRCLDEEVEAPAPGRSVEFRCNGGNLFSVAYGEYTAGDQHLTLSDNQVMLMDAQTQTAHMLNRASAASGERFTSSRLEFWSKGEDAMVRLNNQPLYLGCKAVDS